MLQSRYIVVADFPDGKTVTLYQGAESQAADSALVLAVAEGKAEAVCEFCHPMPSRVRFPLREAAESAARREQGDGREAAEKAAKASRAAALESQAQALLKQAGELRGVCPPAATAEEAEEPESPKAPKAPKAPKGAKNPKNDESKTE